MYVTQMYHTVLRSMCSAEVQSFSEWYDASRGDSMHPLSNVSEIVLCSYCNVCMEVATSGLLCSVTSVLVLNVVVGYPIHIFWPPLSGLIQPSP